METVKKVKRSVVKRERRDAEKRARMQGAVEAQLNNTPTSPRKMQLIANIIRGVPANQALNILKYTPNHAAERMEKLLLTAISDWQLKNADVKLEEANLFVKEVFVGQGRVLKRLQTAPQGRAHRLRKRSNHVTLVVDQMPMQEEKPKKTAAKKTTKEKE